MSTSNDHRPRRPHPNDRAGLLIGALFSLLLLLLWLTGHGPWSQNACHIVTTTITKSLHLDLESADGKVTLYGAVASDADRQAILTAAGGLYDKDKIVDRLTIDALVPALTWSNGAKDLLAKLNAIDPPARFKIDGDELTITGSVGDEDTRTTYGRDAAALLGKETKLHNDLGLRNPPPALPVVEEKPAPPAPAPAPVAAVPPPAAEPVAVSGLIKRTLPGGTVIDIAPDGLETKVIGFIEDRSRPVDKGIWFDFDRLYFNTASSELTEQSKAQIQTLTDILRAFPATSIKIGGYTDNVGDPNFNQKLSAERAERVMKELVAQGIAADRLEAEGYGAQYPAADNATEQGRAKNRRTAVSVRKK